MFLGNPSARVRDELWDMAVKKAGKGSVMQIWSDRRPQGYTYRCHGEASRTLVDMEGITLVRSPSKALPPKKA